jgi:arabinogalactan oligomer/maltooligosaccharide transport system permease protein
MIEQQGTDQAVGAITTPVAGRAYALGEQAFDLKSIRARPRIRPAERIFLWVSRLIIVVFLLLVLFPVAEIVAASFNAGFAFFSPDLVPPQFTLKHYQDVLDPNVNDFGIWMRNSAIVCIGTGVLSVILIASTGYAFSRFHFYGRKYGLMAMLLIQMFPAQMSFIAFYFLLLKIHLLNTLPGLILVFLGGGIPFNAWLFKGYIDGLPRELEESAYVDGATKFQAFWKIILPLTRPMMAVIFIFQIIGIYNDYILTNFLISSQSNYTVAVGLYGFITSNLTQNWTDFAAGACLASLPILIVFMVAQRWLVSGLAAGAVKG